MTVLGAVLAGGLSSRFGADKALATLRGYRLIDLAQSVLQTQCEEVIIVGRPGGVADWPVQGLGPLGGIAGALRHAREKGHSSVLTCGVDSVGIPGDLLDLLGDAPAYLGDQPVVGLWPVEALTALAVRIWSPGSNSVRGFAEAIGARAVRHSLPLANVNTRDDLARLEQ